MNVHDQDEEAAYSSHTVVVSQPRVKRPAVVDSPLRSVRIYHNEIQCACNISAKVLVKIVACSYQQGLNIRDFLNALDMSDGYKDGKINAKVCAVKLLSNFAS